MDNLDILMCYTFQNRLMDTCADSCEFIDWYRKYMDMVIT